jgi:hypothetical protein
MADLRKVLVGLRLERERASKELNELGKAIAVIEKLKVRGTADGATRTRGVRRTRRNISAAGRARIAAAQRARWAKIRQQKKQAKAA